jgi:hypothetical protein
VLFRTYMLLLLLLLLFLCLSPRFSREVRCSPRAAAPTDRPTDHCRERCQPAAQRGPHQCSKLLRTFHAGGDIKFASSAAETMRLGVSSMPCLKEGPVCAASFCS